jgi:hypothetical protein
MLLLLLPLMAMETVPLLGNPVVCTRVNPSPVYLDGTKRFTYTVLVVVPSILVLLVPSLSGAFAAAVL